MRSLNTVAVAALFTLGLGVSAAIASGARVEDRTFLCSTFSAVANTQVFHVDPTSVLVAPDFIVSIGFNGIRYARDQCRPTTMRVALTPARLPGPSSLPERRTCALAGRILVRLRATFTGGHLDRASMAVRLNRRRVPIMFATTRATGEKDALTGHERYAYRQWVSERCF
jgi:hypothetical protein